MTSELPPDGTIIRVSQFLQRFGWVPVALFAFFSVGMLVQNVEKGLSVLALIGPVGAGLAAVTFARIRISGLILESWGLIARTTFRTYRWTWAEVDDFELRERGRVPRLMVHLRDGGAKGVTGFSARTSTEDQRSQALFNALERRLEHEKVNSTAATLSGA